VALSDRKIMSRYGTRWETESNGEIIRSLKTESIPTVSYRSFTEVENTVVKYIIGYEIK
jgi:putative transposase